jgi:hypothetical protein
MQWLVLSWALTCGWLPMSATSIVYPGDTIYGIGGANAISTKMELTAEAWNHLRAWSSIETREVLQPSDFSLGLFSPYEAYFIAGMALYANNIEIGISHECDHGIETTLDLAPWISNGQTEIYIKLSGKTLF